MRVWLLAAIFVLVVPFHPEAGKSDSTADPVPVQIKRILIINDSPAVLLMDGPEQHFLLVFIDFFMANAIRMGMEAPVLSRPLTHDLIGIFLRQLDAKIAKVVINDLKDNTYYAQISLEVNGRTSIIDARPSDALAIAVRHKIPVFAAPNLLRDISSIKEQPREGDTPLPETRKSRPRAST
ncbi:MAG: bifunctional nuclease family protein [SAR324 cluster bacterium]|nr:bifunctional nuclease family protein [SAR324 cluster bacterium]MCZ6841804.1 bifunctional nuclease family protein [SAR324 cluster bacterium]